MMSKSTAPSWFTEAIAQSPTLHTLQARGAQLNCLSWGETTRPALLFLHGGFANAYWFAHLAPALARDFFVLALDFSGHGLSDWRDHYHPHDFIHEISKTLAHFNLNSASLAGFSFGARMAYLYALQYPKQVNQLILLDPPDVTQYSPYNPFVRLSTKPIHYYPSLEAILARFCLIPKQPVTHRYIIDFIAKQSIKITDQGYTWLTDSNLFAKFSYAGDNIPRPSSQLPVTALIYGKYSAISSPESHQPLLAIHPTIQVYCLQNAHHAIMIDQPLALLQHLQTLLQSQHPPT